MSDILSASEFKYHLEDVENAGPGERNPSIRVLFIHDETQRYVLDELLNAARTAVKAPGAETTAYLAKCIRFVEAHK